MKGRVVQIQVPKTEIKPKIQVNARTVDEVINDLPRLAVRAD